jgi:very-short-patch-repair endonuclease
MRCTSPLRTVIDLSGTLSVPELGKLVDYFLRNKLLHLAALRSRVSRTRPAPGRSVRKLHAVLRDRIPGYDPGESELEGRLARLIIRAGLPVPRQQHRVSYGSTRYRVDFAWPERKLYLEGNGFGWHQLSSDLDSDAVRQNEFVLDGWRPIELTWRMTDDFIESTLRRFLLRV